MGMEMGNRLTSWTPILYKYYYTEKQSFNQSAKINILVLYQFLTRMLMDIKHHAMLVFNPGQKVLNHMEDIKWSI